MSLPMFWLQRSIQVWQFPYETPRQLPTPISRQKGPYWEMTISNLTDGNPPPHQCTISPCQMRISLLFIQYMNFLLGLSSERILCCFLRQCRQSYIYLMPYFCRKSVLFQKQVRTTSSPPRWTIGSGKMSKTSAKTYLTSLQVLSRVTSKGPMNPVPKVQATPLFQGARPQLEAWPGVSSSGTTLTPFFIAYFTICLASFEVYVSSGEQEAYLAISGCESRMRGKESSSTMCQCRTFILLYIIASMVSSMRWRGRKWREESIINPLYVSAGWSMITSGNLLNSQFFVVNLLHWMVCVKVSRARTNATQVFALIVAPPLLTLSSYLSSQLVKTLFNSEFSKLISTLQSSPMRLASKVGERTQLAILQ